MEAVIFSGVQAAGKTTFYKERFLETHVHISLDVVGTRAKERLLLNTCIASKQPFVIDNTNPKQSDRAAYVEAAKAAGFKVVCYWFASDAKSAFARNKLRTDKKPIPAPAVFMTAKRFEPPTLDEGFDELWRVDMPAPGEFAVMRVEN